jgi:hypothetical protein
MRVGVARPPPLMTFTLTSKVAVPAEWADTLSLFHLYQYMYSVGPTIESHLLTVTARRWIITIATLTKHGFPWLPYKARATRGNPSSARLTLQMDLITNQVWYVSNRTNE